VNHRALLTRVNEIHGERRCGALLRRACPSSHGANMRSQAATVAPSSIASKPALRHDCSSHSTMKAELRSS
jgi:hypothetical protein